MVKRGQDDTGDGKVFFLDCGMSLSWFDIALHFLMNCYCGGSGCKVPWFLSYNYMEIYKYLKVVSF